MRESKRIGQLWSYKALQWWSRLGALLTCNEGSHFPFFLRKRKNWTTILFIKPKNNQPVFFITNARSQSLSNHPQRKFSFSVVSPNSKIMNYKEYKVIKLAVTSVINTSSKAVEFCIAILNVGCLPESRTRSIVLVVTYWRQKSHYENNGQI